MKKRKYKVVPMPEKYKTIRRLKGEHWHEIKENGEYGGAICINCKPFERFEKTGGHWSWYCPESPDHQCHYEAEQEVWEGHGEIKRGKYFVWSINGEKIILEGYTEEDRKYQSFDYCIFCGNPEERK